MKFSTLSLRAVAVRLASLLMVMAMSVAVSSCGSDDSDDDIIDGPDKLVKSRTVLVYMVANNTLGTNWACDEADFKEMIEAVKNNDLGDGRLLVYHNPPRCSETRPCQLYEVTAEGLKTLKAYPYAEPGESMTSERMTEVMADMKKLATAASYGLVLWSHADNWLGNTGDTDSRYRGFGEDAGYRMSVPTLARSLANEQLAFIYFDCCLMGSVEVLYEMRHITPLAVASPTELGIDGMPYHKNVPVMFDRSLTDEEQCIRMAENTFDYYKNHPTECSGSSSCQKTDECQMTVVRLDRIGRLAKASCDIMRTVTKLPSSLSSLQNYGGTWSNWGAYDMDDYMALLAPADADNPGVESALLTAWRAALAETVVYKATSATNINGTSMRRYCGLGSYAMTNVNQTSWRSYNTLSWWDDVVSKAPVFADNN